MNADLNKSDFAYNATIKLTELPASKASSAFPGITDLAVNSRHFSTYLECVTSVSNLMKDVVDDANVRQAEVELTLTTEVNPEHSGIEVRSKDWATDELARIWIFDKKDEGKNSIRALGQARIFAMARQEISLN